MLLEAEKCNVKVPASGEGLLAAKASCGEAECACVAVWVSPLHVRPLVLSWVPNLLSLPDLSYLSKVLPPSAINLCVWRLSF